MEKQTNGKNKVKIIDLPSHNVNVNRMMWDNYDWSNGGEEWTSDAKKLKNIDPNQWKTSLINGMMLKYIKKVYHIRGRSGCW